MLRSIKDDKGIMGLILSQIGLIIATGILIAAVFSLIFLNDWQRNAELKNIATSFSSMVEGMDTRFFENTTAFRFLDTNYYYNVSISTEYIVVSAKGNLDNDLSVKKRFLVRLWPQSSDSLWIGVTGLHNYLRDNFGNSGNISDPIQKNDVNDVKVYLNDEWEKVAESLVLKPLYILTNKIVYINKAYIYYDINNNGGIWDEKQDFIFVYQ